jgi:transcriptional regulator with XRE-family HTH domain
MKRQMIAMRRVVGLTQEQVEEKLGTKKSNISPLECVSSAVSPRLSTLQDYAHVRIDAPGNPRAITALIPKSLALRPAPFKHLASGTCRNSLRLDNPAHRKCPARDHRYVIPADAVLPLLAARSAGSGLRVHVEFGPFPGGKFGGKSGCARGIQGSAARHNSITY